MTTCFPLLFECLFSEFTESKYTVSCASGTDALELILRALEIGKNDEVILPTNTFIATALAVTRCGAMPVFVDNDEFYLIDTKQVEKKITKKTKAIIAVNLYGQLANLKELNKIAKANSLKLIEAGADAVKLEGGKEVAGEVGAIGGEVGAA